MKYKRISRDETEILRRTRGESFIFGLNFRVRQESGESGVARAQRRALSCRVQLFEFSTLARARSDESFRYVSPSWVVQPRQTTGRDHCSPLCSRSRSLPFHRLVLCSRLSITGRHHNFSPTVLNYSHLLWVIRLRPLFRSCEYLFNYRAPFPTCRPIFYFITAKLDLSAISKLYDIPLISLLDAFNHWQRHFEKDAVFHTFLLKEKRF